MDELASLIRQARGDMREYQRRLKRTPTLAQVSVADVPHALVPTHVVARDLPQLLDEIVGAESAPLVMYRIGYIIGRTQAAAFFEDGAIDTADSLYRVLTGPFHLAWAGYGDVDLLMWEPHLNERFAVLWESEHSCSAREAAGEHCRTRACHLQAGYSAGWCTEATNLPLETCELACRAEGLAHCRFLVSHAAQMHANVLDPRFHKPTASYAVTPTRAEALVPR
jgi:predicted hydrocarbon binding protein